MISGINGTFSAALNLTLRIRHPVGVTLNDVQDLLALKLETTKLIHSKLGRWLLHCPIPAYLDSHGQLKQQATPFPR
jgi:hypothetical protein